MKHHKEPTDLRPQYTSQASLSLAILAILLAIGVYLLLNTDSFADKAIITTDTANQSANFGGVIPAPSVTPTASTP